MNRLLLVVGLLLSNLALADDLAVVEMSAASATCVHADATEQAKNSPEVTTATFQVSANLKTVIRKEVSGTTETSKEFNLTMVGKDTYLASPTEASVLSRGPATTTETPLAGGGSPDYFFLKISGDRIAIYSMDPSGSECGGGLQVTQLTK